MLRYTGPICVQGRKPMSAVDKREHIVNCPHPQCVYLKEFYAKVVRYVEENLTKEKTKRFPLTK